MQGQIKKPRTTEQKKREAAGKAREILDGKRGEKTAGLDELAKEYGVSSITIRSWVDKYAAESSSTIQEKIEVVKRAQKILGSQSGTKTVDLESLADEYHVSPSTIRRWVKKYISEENDMTNNESAVNGVSKDSVQTSSVIQDFKDGNRGEESDSIERSSSNNIVTTTNINYHNNPDVNRIITLIYCGISSIDIKNEIENSRAHNKFGEYERIVLLLTLNTRDKNKKGVKSIFNEGKRIIQQKEYLKKLNILYQQYQGSNVVDYLLLAKMIGGSIDQELLKQISNSEGNDWQVKSDTVIAKELQERIKERKRHQEAMQIALGKKTKRTENAKKGDRSKKNVFRVSGVAVNRHNSSINDSIPNSTNNSTIDIPINYNPEKISIILDFLMEQSKKAYPYSGSNTKRRDWLIYTYDKFGELNDAIKELTNPNLNRETRAKLEGYLNRIIRLYEQHFPKLFAHMDKRGDNEPSFPGE